MASRVTRSTARHARSAHCLTNDSADLTSGSVGDSGFGKPPSSASRSRLTARTVTSPSQSAVTSVCEDPGVYATTCTRQRVVEIIKRRKIATEFTVSEITYYGVSQAQLLLTGKDAWKSPLETAFHLASVLRDVTDECSEVNLRVGLRNFEAALQDSVGCLSIISVYLMHGLRVMANLVVAYQDYYKHHPSRLFTLQTHRDPTKGGRGTPLAIAHVYDSEVNTENYLEVLRGRLETISDAWRGVLEDLLEQKQSAERQTDLEASGSLCTISVATDQANTAEQDSQFGSKTMEYSGSDATGPSSPDTNRFPEIRQSLLVRLRYGAIDIANQNHLRGLAKASSEHNWSATPTIDFLGIVPELSEKLAKRHQTYLGGKLLPYLERKKILKVVVLAVILGFWEVVRVLPDGCKIKNPLPKLVRRLRGIGIGLSKSEPQFSSEIPYGDIWIEDIGIRDECQVISRR